MPFPQHPDDAEDYFHGTPQQEAHREMVQEWGREKADHEWILTDYDVWERNPYFTGVRTEGHPEDEEDRITDHEYRYERNANRPDITGINERDTP